MTRPTKRTPKKEDWQAKFLKLLSNTGNVTLSARGAGIARRSVYDYRHADAQFAAGWEAAIDEAVEMLEAEAWARARKTSDTLLIFLLKANRPGKYRENIKVDHEGAVKVIVEYADYNPKTSSPS
jgi:hypothetical protein